MPRTLPWLLDQKPEARVKAEPTPRKRVKREQDSDSDRAPRRPPSPSEKRDFFRSSQSPPTSPVRPCPPEEFLIEGLDHDDGWIMVEDEFYAVAQSFTQHLHYAEYVRRKKEVKAQSAAAIGDIERPTDGRTIMPKEILQRKEAEALAARQKAGLEQLAGQDNDNDDDDDDDDDAWAGTHLHGLLTSPRKVRSLAGAHAMKSSTRAAAGFGQASGLNALPSQVSAGSPPTQLSRGLDAHKIEFDEETEPSEDDDLDGQAYTVTMPTRRVESKAHSTSSRTVVPDPTKCGNKVKAPTSTIEKQVPAARKSHQPTRLFKSRVQTLFDDLDELPEPARSDTPISDNRKRSSTAKSTPEAVLDDNMAPITSRYKDVPTFLV